MIKILKYKAKRRRIRKRVPKRIWGFGLFWEAEIYARTAIKYEQTSMQNFKGEHIDILEWT